MEPMKPMAPMEPMTPMKPMAPMETWWPDELGQPATSGAQNSARYAFFPEKRRLLIEQGGKLTTYDSGDHRISGVSQQQRSGGVAGVHEPERNGEPGRTDHDRLRIAANFVGTPCPRQKSRW